MIICPICKEEIDDASYYCDQCGQYLSYCERCGRVGVGRRCTTCGSMMLPPDEYLRKSSERKAFSTSASMGFVSNDLVSQSKITQEDHPTGQTTGVPQLLLSNDSLGIRMVGVNGAIIGRRQGPYVQFFQQNMYVSGVHAQIRFNAETGWCVADKHSTNGTKLNNHQLQPDVEMSLKSGDILSIANVALKITIN